MQLKNINLNSAASPLSVKIKTNKCIVICSTSEDDATTLLRKIAGIDSLCPEEFIEFDESINNQNIRYFFRQGILLSNLTLLENIELPFKYLYPKSEWSEYYKRLEYWVDYFRLKIDLNLRPACFNESTKKIVSYIRNLVIESDLYVINDPLFQLSYADKKKIIDLLLELKDYKKSIIIGSTDIELIDVIADSIVIINSGQLIGIYEVSDINRKTNIEYLKKFMDEN